MTPQNDIRRYVMQAMMQHGQLSPRFQGLLQAMQAPMGQQQMMQGTRQMPDPSTGLPENDPRNGAVYAQRRGQVKAGLDAQRQRGMHNAALMAMDRGDID